MRGCIEIRFKKIFKIFIILLVICITSILVPNIIIKNNVKPNIKTVSEVSNSQVAIVLGAHVFSDGRLCDMLTDRVETGVELYKLGKINKILMSGDHGEINYDEVNNMRKYAESLGVPTEDIFMDHAGFSTYESMYRAKEIFKVNSAVIVTQKFHLPRAVYIAKRVGINVTGVKADKHIYAGEKYYEYREILARVKDFVQVNITHTKPTFLGEAIPISGDGRATHDLK